MNNWKNEKNLTSEEIRKAVKESDLIGKADLYQNGVEAFNTARDEGIPCGVVCALLNSDTRGVLLPLLRDNPEKILKGIMIAAIAMDADEAFLYIPDYADDLVPVVSDLCEQYNVRVERGIVDVRKTAGCLCLTIAEASEVCDLFYEEGYKAGCYVSPEGGAPVKVSPDTKLSELIDIDGAQAIISGMHLLTPSEAEMTIAEAAPEDGYLHAVGASECIIQTVSAQLAASGKQSCGKCVFCREGLIQLAFMHKEMTSGRGKAEHMDLTKEIGSGMCVSTPCTMGQQSALMALDALDKFGSVYKDHIKKKCSVCFSKEVIYIDPKLCKGCEECADVCPKDCIEGKAKFIHMIDDFDCDLCGKCIEVCEYDAIIKTSGKVPKLPNKLTKVGKFKR
jgi:fumarate reductase flavoprotein subunit/NADH-quinone oxidoreductase subunit F